jgi:uncharacterized protein YjbJ (UPF0337 family)
MRNGSMGSGGAMSIANGVRNRRRIRHGRAKQKIGSVTRSQRLQAGGLADRNSGSVQQFGGDLGKEFRKVSRRIERAFGR